MPYRQGSVVVIEDNPSIRQLVDDALTDEGFRVVVFATFTAALQWLAETQEQPCVLLLNAIMPDMRLDDFLRAYRQLPTEQAPLVLCSGDDRQLARQHELSAAATLAKPFDLDELVRMVQRLCAVGKPTDTPH